MFPNGFVWGAASSAYQIEGAARTDGRTDSVWDVFSRTPGMVHAGHTGEVACDHYNKMPEDVALMKSLGIKHYRFSISWSRVMPDGVGRINEKGLAFYDKLVNELLAAGIVPWVTLFHWDYPQALYRRGGWQSPESPTWFAEYAKVIVDRLSDRVTHWMTINEPQIFLGHGHLSGTQAPGLKLSIPEFLRAGHHALMAHGTAVQVIRAHAKKPPIIGWAPCGRVDFPATESPADVNAARDKMFEVFAKDAWNNSWWADPVVLGRYPESGIKLFGADMPKFPDRDMQLIRQPIDFYGVNIYNGTAYRAGEDGKAVEVPHPVGGPLTAFRWPITPPSLYWGPRFLHERYGLPIIITENGMANLDWVSSDGAVHDPQRIEYTRTYLRELARATREGHATGYFHWSILDNFEWAEGYAMRFGLIHVDYATQKRTPKDSAKWYAKVIASNGASLNEA